MKFDPEKVAENFLELASEQRIRIIENLLEKKYNLTQLTKKLDTTTSEVHRHLNRLLDSGIIVKGLQNNYELSLYGKTLCVQIPSLFFISENKKFFDEHNFGNLDIKFIQRLGALQNGEKISGFVRVLEKWKEVHNNSQEFIYNILTEVPYSEDIIESIASKLKKGVPIHSIIYEKAVIPNERKKIFKQKNFQNYIDDNLLNRRMKKDISVVTLLNEKEACLIFPKSDGKSDMSEMFYSDDPLFHEWCYDYFKDSWDKSRTFRESKLER